MCSYYASSGVTHTIHSIPFHSKKATGKNYSERLVDVSKILNEKKKMNEAWVAAIEARDQSNYTHCIIYIYMLLASRVYIYFYPLNNIIIHIVSTASCKATQFISSYNFYLFFLLIFFNTLFIVCLSFARSSLLCVCE